MHISMATSVYLAPHQTACWGAGHKVLKAGLSYCVTIFFSIVKFGVGVYDSFVTELWH